MGAGKNGKGRVSPSKRQNIYSYIVCNCHKMYVQVGTDSERPGGYSLILKSYTYVPPQRVWFLPRAQAPVFAPFWSKNGYRLCPFWSGIGYGFRGNKGSVSASLLFQFQMCKKEREIREFKKSFFLLSTPNQGCIYKCKICNKFTL